MNMAGDDVMKELLLLLYTNQIFYFMKMSPAWFFQYIQSANKEAKKSMNKWKEGRKILMCHLPCSEMGGDILLYMCYKNGSRLLHRTIIRTKWEPTPMCKQRYDIRVQVEKK